MDLHANAKLGLAGRRELVLAIEGGLSLKRAAARFSVSPATAHRWWHRWIDGDRQRAALADRSSRPLRQPRRLSADEEASILKARRETNLGPGRMAGIVRRARSEYREGARPPWPVAALARAAAELPPLRVVTARGAAAHGRQEARPLHRARPPRHRRPHQDPGAPPGRLRPPALRRR